MLGERSDQKGLWEVDRLNLDHVRWESSYCLLASLWGQLFRNRISPSSTAPTMAGTGRRLACWRGAAAPVPRQGERR